MGFVAFQALVLTINTSETDSKDLETDSISPLTHLSAMTTLKVVMALKPCSCVTYFQAKDTLSKLIDNTWKVLLLDMIVYMEILVRILILKNKLCTNPRQFYHDTLLSIARSSDYSGNLIAIISYVQLAIVIRIAC